MQGGGDGVSAAPLFPGVPGRAPRRTHTLGPEGLPALSEREPYTALLAFVLLVFLPQVSERAFFALSAASDLLPLRKDLDGLFPPAAGRGRAPDPLEVLLGPGLFLLLMVLGTVSPAWNAAVMAAGDIVPFPRDFRRVAGLPETPGPIRG